MNEGDTVELRPGLTKTVTKTGNGTKPEDGETVTMQYHGTLDDGTVFDSTKGKSPFKFRLGNAEVILGWDITVATMTVGEKAVVHIPADYGYGKERTGSIPPNSELTFELELVSTEDATCKGVMWSIIGLLVFLFFAAGVLPRLVQH